MFITLNLKGFGNGACNRNLTTKEDSSPDRQSKIMVTFLSHVKPSLSTMVSETRSLYHGFYLFESILGGKTLLECGVLLIETWCHEWTHLTFKCVYQTSFFFM